MAWHLHQILDDPMQQQQQPSFERISFTEITPSAVQHAVEHPVSINPGLVQAQETRRILDRLAGFTVSPLLWKKIAPGLSAGRVQSVAMALVVQRERERLMFEQTEYWSVHASFVVNRTEKEQGHGLTAQLQSIDGVPVASAGKDFASQGQTLAEASAHKMHLTAEHATRLVNLFQDEATEWRVVGVKSTKRQQQPPQPYRTSTLQQDVNRRLGLGVDQCMRTAQELYENGLISYMRTDATHISQDAETSLKRAVVSSYGKDMYEKREGTPSKRKKESKFAQEAHEAIRPAIQPDGTFLVPDESLHLSNKVAKDLYRMIYQRTLACRMPNLITNLTQVTIEATCPDGTTGIFRASGSVVLSPGYTAAYGALGIDTDDEDDSSKRELPKLTEGQVLDRTDVEGVDHETQPLPRFTEASFVKELEALGVGRPSTYAGIVKILRERAYVGSPLSSNQSSRSRKEVSGSAISAHRAAGGEQFTGAAKGSLVPSLSAFAVCSLLEDHCPNYVNADFTAHMEERLDHIANSESSSEEERLRYLDEFYAGDAGLASIVKRVEETVVGEDLRSVDLPTLRNSDTEGGIRLLVGPWGPYVQSDRADGAVVSASVPPSMAADLSTITLANLQGILSTKETGGYLMGPHPDDGRNIRLKTGRFGPYLQVGEDGEDETTTHSLPRGLPLSNTGDVDDASLPEDYPPNMPVLTFEEALGFACLPRVVTELDGTPITAAVGPYGPYLKYNSMYVNLDDGKEIIAIDGATAEALMREALASDGKRKPLGTLEELGEMDGSIVRVKSGRFGKYISWKRTNVKLPDEYSEDNMPSLVEAWDLICQKVDSAVDASKKSIAKKDTSSVDLPPAPKRPPSAYIIFCSATRPTLAGQQLSLGESSRRLSQLWYDLPKAEKEKFEMEASQRKEAYEEEKQSWKEECQRLLGGKPIKPIKGSPKAIVVKRPKNAFLFFCQDKRPEVSQNLKSLGDVQKELALLWRETSDRSQYERLAAEDKERYEREMGRAGPVAEKATGASEPNTVGKLVSTKTQKSPRKAKKENSVKKQKTPTKRTPSAYMLFCKEFRASLVDEDGNKLPLGEGSKRLASMWKSCDTATRERFEQLALEEKQNAKLVSTTT